MSSSSPTTSEPVVPESNHRQSTGDFVRWALTQLKLDFVEAAGVACLPLPEADQESFPGQVELKLPLQPGAQDESCEAIELDSHFGQWLLSRLHAIGPTVPIRPTEQPTAVNDIAQNLFAAYQVDGGRVHLGGCQLTDYPFLRLSFVTTDNGQERFGTSSSRTTAPPCRISSPKIWDCSRWSPFSNCHRESTTPPCVR